MPNVQIAKILKENGVKFSYSFGILNAFCKKGLNWVPVSGWTEKQIIRRWVKQ